MTASGTLARSPLDAAHRALDATMAEFGGWEMPISYASGTIHEHMACRRAAAMFDVSHLGTVRVAGPDAFDVLQRAFTNDLNKVAPGHAQYTHLLDADDASVLDDIIIWWHPRDDGDDDVFDVMPNASNTDRVRGAIGGDDITTDRAVIAVQGPTARSLVRAVFPDAAEVGRFRVAQCTWGGHRCTVAGTGYTGEAGIEIAVPADVAMSLWDALAAAGATPAGLGRATPCDSKRASRSTATSWGPASRLFRRASAGWWRGTSPSSSDSAAALAERDSGIARRLFGIAVDGRRPPRAGCVVSLDGAVDGEVTSGNFSPVLGHGIALAFLPPDAAEGQPVDIDLRGKTLTGHVVSVPFVG